MSWVVTLKESLLCLFIRGVKGAVTFSAIILDQTTSRGTTQTKSKKRKKTSEEEPEAAAKKVKKSKKERKTKKKIKKFEVALGS